MSINDLLILFKTILFNAFLIR